MNLIISKLGRDSGTDLVWRQFPYYVAGSLIGWMLMRLLGRRQTTDNRRTMSSRAVYE